MKSILQVVVSALVLSYTEIAMGAELVVLSEQNWDQLAPAGKEADAIYGDFVLKNDRLVAVVAQAVETRNANMTVRNIGGSLIDLTFHDKSNDQLSAFYPHSGDATLSGPIDWAEAFGPNENSPANAVASARLAFRLQLPQSDEQEQDRNSSALEYVVGYELADGTDYVTVITKVTNPAATEARARLRDGVRADGEFAFGFDEARGLWWAEDRFWGQAYGIQPVGNDFAATERSSGERRRPRPIRYTAVDGGPVVVPPNSSIVLRRHVFPAENSLQIQELSARERDIPVTPVEISVADPNGRVAGAEVELRRAGEERAYGAGRTNDDGRLSTSLPPGQYKLNVQSHGRRTAGLLGVTAAGDQPVRREIKLPAVGFVEAEITDESGRPIACRVAFLGKDGAPNPNFGPDSAIYGVRNLQHTPNGKFRIEILPGRYEVVISHGPEYDAVLKTIDVQPGATSRLAEKLVRSVDTTGWLSADFHSHSSPSGDNTSSQEGRVLNLLTEHIEFAPCTEHNRITTYVPHLTLFQALDRMATCCGMELTGQPLPLNHQNAFPLVHRPHTQDGGGPTTHADPVVQIERLAMWDNGSDKLVQINHPNIVQMLGDKDQDGVADGGFERMFHFMDVMEVHPPGNIFKSLAELSPRDRERGNRMFHWLQLLNLGYRVPAVVNTDAHWNYYGSGGVRNYIRSTTDDPAQASIAQLVRESELGHIVITNGPFLEVSARSDKSGAATALPGDNLEASDGKLTLHVRVRCANWIQVNRVQLFINGRAVDEHNYTRRRHAAMFENGPVIFDQQLPVALEGDAHIVVATVGEDVQLGAPYGPVNATEESSGEAVGTDMPVAVANPIYVDVDGGGFTANGDTLGLPLPVTSGHRPSHGHDHENSHKH